MLKLFFMDRRHVEMQKSGSDIDLLILIDKEKVSPQEEDTITTPIYDLEIESGIII